MRPTYLLLITLTMLLVSCGEPSPKEPKKSFSSEIKNIFADDFISQIHTHKDLRDVKWLTKNLSTQNPVHLKTIFNALASCKDTTTFNAIIDRLGKEDIDEQLYTSGMYALGSVTPKDSTPVLIELLYPEITTAQRESILIAIGRIGSDNGYHFLINQKVSTGVIQGLYRSLLNGKSGIESVEKAVKALEMENDDIKLWAAYLLNREREIDLTPHFEIIKKAYSQAADEDLKTALSGCFRNVIGQDKISFLTKELNKELTPLLKVNLLKSFRKEEVGSAYKNILSLIHDPITQVSQTAIAQLRKGFNPELMLNDLSELEAHIDNPIVRLDIIKLLITHKSDKKDLTYQVDQLYSKSDNNMIKSGCVRAMGGDISNLNWLQNQMHKKDDVVIQGIVHETMLSMDLDSLQRSDLIELGLKSNNVALICQSAGAITEDTFLDKHNSWLKLANDKVDELVLPRQLEAYIELQKCISTLSGNAIKTHVPKYNHPINWSIVSQLPNKALIEVTTTKGVIIWELYVDRIPAAASAIINLIDSGYYDHKIFHRVVPNFVAQGGCPRGDGWGSLDFSLRSEYDQDMRYITGAIGLASAGENTESCQFFMTHAPTPHLDNRYTIIGYVTKGLDVLNKLEVGDEIISMKRTN